MLSPEVRKTLNDPENFKGVSPETRTDIIGMIDYDIDGLVQEEGGKFTHEELCNGLHYLLATNKDLHVYIEQAGSQVSSSDPFFISSRELHDLGLSIYCLDSLGNCDCCGCFDGEMEAILIACAFLCALAAIAGLFVLIYKNTRDMLKGEESSLIKIAKIMISLIVFIGVTVPVCFFMPSIYIYGLSSVLAFFCGALALALCSYANKKILFLPNKQLLKPSDELLDALEVTKKTLKEGYARQGDDKEACMKFVKAVVRLHINSISKPEKVISKLEDIESSSSESASSVGGHGSFFSMPSANDADKRIEDSPTCSVQTNG